MSSRGSLRLSLIAVFAAVVVLVDEAAGSGAVDYHENSSTRGTLRRLEDDDITSRIPQIDYFRIFNDENSDQDVCEIGCEGDYSALKAALEELWDTEEKEYELFFLVRGRYAVAAGVICDTFPQRVQELKRNHPAVDTIILVECPGSANDDDGMIPGAKMVHNFGYQTCVPSDGHTASGGTDFFTAGVKRYATPGARLGIHSWWYGDGEAASDLPRDHPWHQQYLEFADDICIPRDFYWKTLSYGLPMHYITSDELNRDFPYLRDCSGTCESPSGGSTCYYSEDENDIVPNCSCHPSCSTCGYNDYPVDARDCITCADGSPVDPYYDDGTGTCNS